MTDGSFKIINENNFEITIKAIYWNLGYCTDGDFNSLTVEFDYIENVLPKFDNKIFMVETSRWLVEESSISNLDIDYIIHLLVLKVIKGKKSNILF